MTNRYQVARMVDSSSLQLVSVAVSMYVIVTAATPVEAALNAFDITFDGRLSAGRK